MKVTIATAPCSWGVWYPDGTPSGTPWHTFLDQAASAGYQALELGPIGYLPANYQDLSTELEKRSLSVCAGTACYAFAQISNLDSIREELNSLCALLVQMNAKYLVTMDESDVGRFGEKKSDLTPSQSNKYLQIIREMAAFTFQEHGIKTVFHPHIKSLYEYENEIQNLMEATGIDLCFDTGHHTYSNGSPEAGDRSSLDFLLKYPERIAYLHFKNVDGQIKKRVLEENLDSDQAFDLDVMCDLEDGIIDFRELKTVLETINFEGIGVIEQDMPRATTDQAFTSAKRNLNFLKEINLV